MKSGLRGSGINLPSSKDAIGLPGRPFLFTLDQISVLIDVPEVEVKKHYVFFEGRSIGARRRDLLLSRNIAPDDATPDWRVAERELIRWMKFKGFRYYERGAYT